MKKFWKNAVIVVFAIHISISGKAQDPVDGDWYASHGCMTNANERAWSLPYQDAKVATVAVVFTKTNGTSFGRCTGTFKINFDRGYEWFLSPDVGYLALYDKAGLFYPKDHDTLTLKTYH